MNSARSGRAFLAFVIVDILFVTAIYAVLLSGGSVPDLDFAQNILLSESIVLLPILFMALIQKEKGTKINDFLGFHKIRFTTILLVILYTILCIPLANFMNAVSMLFVDNVVGQVAGEVADMPFWLMFLTMAMFGPMCEELAFRGVIYHGYRRSRNLVGAVIMSALAFGIMHMNFNQLGYAFALGVMMALLMEATGSIWATFIMHMVFNGQSVVT
ncbi:MAG: CPBP family intramembrane metalloprotease, partial [Lachnospiraceae bacterium]|nr:CPBP family intramembrane metalloprotease [Lachnospiraceae bacterium]